MIAIHILIFLISALSGLRLARSEIGKCVQGFLTNKNRFVDRDETSIIAYNEKQILKPTTKLYFEDLYYDNNII